MYLPPREKMGGAPVRGMVKTAVGTAARIAATTPAVPTENMDRNARLRAVGLKYAQVLIRTTIRRFLYLEMASAMKGMALA
jgi:hypothetical protein